MKTMFQNRQEAGLLLAQRLHAYAGRNDVIVVALARGGVPVAHAIAAALQLPLDVLVVRKLGVPGREELAFGAVASGGVQVLHSEIVARHRLKGSDIASVAERERSKLARSEKRYRGARPPAILTGRTVILVDDGVATGATMRAALLLLRHRGVATIVVAAPVMAPEAHAALQSEADRVIAVLVPPGFSGVGEWYEDFVQITDAEVNGLLREFLPPEQTGTISTQPRPSTAQPGAAQRS